MLDVSTIRRMHHKLLKFCVFRHEHRREKPFLIDQPNGFHKLLQGCCINVFCRHVGRILRTLDLSQFQALTPEFFLNPQVSGLHVSHATETDPSSERDCTTVVKEMLNLCGFISVKENGLNKRCLGDSHCACVVFCIW